MAMKRLGETPVQSSTPRVDGMLRAVAGGGNDECWLPLALSEPLGEMRRSDNADLGRDIGMCRQIHIPRQRRFKTIIDMTHSDSFIELC